MSQNAATIDFENLKHKQLNLLEINQLITRIKEQQKNELNEMEKMEMVIDWKPVNPVLANLKTFDFAGKLRSIQTYINEFEYNFTNMQLSTYQKKKNMADIAAYAKVLIKQRLPIKCLDAFVMAAYLTADIDRHCVRFPLRFLSQCEGKSYWHIVLGVYYAPYGKPPRVGAIGISRKNDKLGYKKCSFLSLLSLIDEFIASYQSYQHSVRMVTIGLPLSDSIYCTNPICYDQLQISNHCKEHGIDAYRDILNSVLSSWLKSHLVIFQALIDSHKPYIFDNNIVFDSQNGTYHIKQQYEHKTAQNIEQQIFDEDTSSMSNDVDTKIEDLNGV